MKTEQTLKKEIEDLKQKMIEVGTSEGTDSFRFIHLSVAFTVLNWAVDGVDSHSPTSIDETFEIMQRMRGKDNRQEDGRKKLQDLLESIKKGDAKLEKIEVIGKGNVPHELVDTLKKLFETEQPNSEKPQEKAPDMTSVLKEIEESRKIKNQRKEEDITKTKEFKSLANKLGIKFKS